MKTRTVLIPGASRPIGRAIARMFGEAGYELFLPCYDWPESVAEMDEEFSQLGYKFTIKQVDLRKKSEIKKYFKELKTQISSLTVLVNNIERGGMPIVHGSYDHKHNKKQWDREFDTTLKAKWLLYRYSKKLLLKGKNSSLINISSIAGIVGRRGPAELFYSDGYSAANGGISTLTKTWACELAPKVRVNELMLGMIDSRHGKGTRGWATMSKKEKKNLKDRILLERTGQPKEVARAVMFLAHEATYMTGNVIQLDGGYTLGSDRVKPLPSGILAD